MKKKLRAFLALVLMLALLVPQAALADLTRGSKGDEVLELQTMLFDMGYLFEEPDGQFGAKTETAVKEYQNMAGLDETGMVTDELMARISQDWVDYQNWIREQLELDASYQPYCFTWETENGQTIFEYCEKHARLWEATFGMLMSDDAESALYSYYEWQAEVISMYNEWIALVDASARAQLEVNKALCIQLMEAQLDALRMSDDIDAADHDPKDVYYSAELWMRAHCAMICQVLHTLNAE